MPGNVQHAALCGYDLTVTDANLPPIGDHQVGRTLCGSACKRAWTGPVAVTAVVQIRTGSSKVVSLRSLPFGKACTEGKEADRNLSTAALERNE